MLRSVSDALSWLNEEKKERETELKSLGETLPEALANWALKNTGYDKTTEIKQRIAKAEEFLQDYPIIIEVLGKRDKHSWSIIRHADRIAEKRVRCEELKAQLIEEYNLSFAKNLLELAKTVDIQLCNHFMIESTAAEEDAERFLSELERPK